MGVAERLDSIASSIINKDEIWHVFDIETGYGSANEISLKIENWKPPNTMKKEETIEAAREKFAIEAKQKSSLTDIAPIICLSFQGSNGDMAVFSCMPKVKDFELPEYELHQFDSEREMLKTYAEYLSDIYEKTVSFTLAGHNIRSFDLPKIRNRMIRFGLKIPPVLLPYASGVNIYDTMERCKHFGVELNKAHRDTKGFVSFDLLAQALGIDSHKSIMTGGEVPENHEKALLLLLESNEEGFVLIKEILTYSMLDAQKEAKAFKLMSGNY